MNILITGASGIIGQHLINFFLNQNASITIFSYTNKTTYNHKNITTIAWNPTTMAQKNILTDPQKAAFKHANIIINLAGESVNSGRFTKKLKQKILQSRLNATQALINLMQATNNTNITWIQISGTGFYGSQANQQLTEKSPKGTSFLATVCDAHETLIQTTVKPTINKTIILRLGLVLASNAPAWKKIKFPISIGFGSKLGPGNQYWAWIHIDDVINSINHLISTPTKNTIFNLCAPNPLTQLEFTKHCAKQLNRPLILPAPPTWLLKLIIGQAIDELLLPSQRVIPHNLNNHNYTFKYPTLAAALKNL